MGTQDVRPFGDRPDNTGMTAVRGPPLRGITSLARVTAKSERDLLPMHGVGP